MSSRYEGNYYHYVMYSYGLGLVYRNGLDESCDAELAVLQGDEAYELQDAVDNAESPAMVDLLLDAYDY